MLELAQVSRSFGRLAAVRDISLTIPAGTTLGLLGPNGAGKTTTMRMILGILVPDRGTITWRGRAIDARTRRTFGYLPEERGLYGKMTVREQIIYIGRLHGLTRADAHARLRTWLARLELERYEHSPCAELSKGNQQKVQVACAALHEPEFLILDEPFSGLDPVNADILIRVLRDQQRNGVTLVLSSHQMWQIEDLCERICIIAGGEMRANDTLVNLRAAWPTRVVEVEPASAIFADVLAREPGAHARPHHNGTLSYEMPRDCDLPALARRLTAAGDLMRFERREPSLHDIYLHAIGADS